MQRLVPRPTVYFVASEDMQRVKIGKADDWRRRWDNLRRHNPYPQLLLATVRGARHVEGALHARFADDGLHGEWFRTSADLEAIVLDVQSTGPLWSAVHYPLHLRADEIDLDGSPLLGRGRYIARDELRAAGFRMRNGGRRPRETGRPGGDNFESGAQPADKWSDPNVASRDRNQDCPN